MRFDPLTSSPSAVDTLEPVKPPLDKPTGWRRRWAILRVTARRQLITPMLRGNHDPAFYARASAVGFFFNFTPSVGAQIPMVVALWTVARFLMPRWDFHLGVACAWTLLTSVPTVPPMYYGFYLTGQLMLGRWEKPAGFEFFTNALHDMHTGSDWLESLWMELTQLWELFGLPLFIGSLPWGFGTGWLAYIWTVRMINRHRARRLAAAIPKSPAARLPDA
ncbi:MAG: DUF2062 domain-containing protein [Magnetococcales bacterium]|nr:DUF2062 domain-containing protein [Magnetococcales bacterium]